MKIIVMGGAGDVGSRAAEDFAIAEDVEEIAIADRNTEAAKKVADKLKDSGKVIEIKEVDANDHDGLVEAMRGYDVAASALGPFYMFEAKLVRAAIEAEVDYASVCDEWNAAEAVLNEFGDAAREKGRIVLSGLGTSPGISNVGVKYLSEKMDRIRRADISVYQPLSAGGGEAVIRHMLFIMTGEVAVWRDGEKKMIKACSEERTIKFPQFGKIKLWNMGHGEPITIPRFMPEIEEVNFFMGYGKGAMFFVLPARWGLFKSRRGMEAAVKLIEFIEKKMPGGDPEHGAVRIDVWGEKDGKETHRLLCGVGQMREVTGLSLSIGTLMLGRKELSVAEGGVYAPEGCIDPDKFITCLKKKGVEAFEDIEMTKGL